MDGQFIIYIDSLLSQRKREVKILAKKRLGDPELAMTVKQETDWELAIIAESQKALYKLQSYPKRPSLRETQAMQARNRGGI
mgnify:CR=1 FL=1